MKKVLLILLSVFLSAFAGCGGAGTGGGTSTQDYASTLAAGFDDTYFSALMVDKNGQTILPIALKDDQNNIVGIAGALWYDQSGLNITVYLDQSTRLPTKVILGDFAFVFSNWSSDRTKVDIAKVYTYGGGYVKIWRQASISAFANTAALFSTSWCVPNCGSDAQTLVNFLNAAGTGILLGACGISTTVSLQALGLPCSGSNMAAAAAATTGDEGMFNNAEAAIEMLASSNSFGCADTLDYRCLISALGIGGKILHGGLSGGQTITGSFAVSIDPYADAGSTYLEEASNTDGTVAAGSDADLPSCATTTPDTYQCTHGGMINFEPCYPDGFMQCQADCSWSACLASGTAPSDGGGSTAGCSPNYNIPPLPDDYFPYDRCSYDVRCNTTTCCSGTCVINSCRWLTQTPVLGGGYTCQLGNTGYLINDFSALIDNSHTAETKFTQCLALKCPQ